MATINLQIPDALLPRLLVAIADHYGWDPEGGQTRAQFAQSVLIRHCKDILRNHEANVAARQASAAKDAEIEDAWK